MKWVPSQRGAFFKQNQLSILAKMDKVDISEERGEQDANQSHTSCSGGIEKDFF